MIQLIPVIVGAHSGYRAEEYPNYFVKDEVIYDIKKIADRWHQGDTDPQIPSSQYFKVIADNGSQYLLKHQLDTDEWYLVK